MCERFLGSVQPERLDHVLILILHEKQLHPVLRASVTFFNRARPQQGIQHQVPEGEVPSVGLGRSRNRITTVPILGGLHHEYPRVA